MRIDQPQSDCSLSEQAQAGTETDPLSDAAFLADFQAYIAAKAKPDGEAVITALRLKWGDDPSFIYRADFADALAGAVQQTDELMKPPGKKSEQASVLVFVFRPSLPHTTFFRDQRRGVAHVEKSILGKREKPGYS